jgi:hypothetical protein
LRRFLLIMVAVSGLVAAGAGLAWTIRQPLAQWATQHLLEGQGLGPSEFRIERIGLRGVTVRDVSLRGGALRLDTLDVVFDPLALVHGEIGMVSLDGLKLAIAVRDGSITLGGQGFQSSAQGGSTRGLSIGRLRLTNATLTLAGFGSPDTLRVATADVGLRLAPDGAVHATLGDVALSAPGLPWTIAEGAAVLDWTAGQGSFEIAIGRASSTARPAVVHPLAMRLAGKLAEGKIDFKLRATMAAGESLQLTLTGRHDLATNAGQTDLMMAPVTFETEGLQPADLFPIVGVLPMPFGGTVSADGRLGWRGGRITPDITLHLAGGRARPPGAEVDDIATTIRLVALQPPATAPGQIITATVTGGGLPPTPVTLGFELHGSQLKVERLEAAFAGGRLATSPFAVSAAGPLAVDTAVELADVDLAEVFKLIDIDGLAGTGKLGGTIPLRWADGRLAVAGGALATTGPGRLSLARDRLPPALAQAGEDVALAVTALADFHYDSLSLALDKNAGGQGSVRITIRGSNPQVMDGQPFVFNINVESDFDRLTELALHSMTATQDLLRRAERSLSP